jgi:hypothetical protein
MRTIASVRSAEQASGIKWKTATVIDYLRPAQKFVIMPMLDA